MYKKISIILILSTFSSLSIAEEAYVVIKARTRDIKPISANVDSVHHTIARVRNAGTIDGISVTEGDKVDKGQIIALVIDPKQPLAIDSIDAKLKALEYQYNLAALEFSRISDLKTNGAATQQSYDEAKTKMNVSLNSFNDLKSQRDLAVQHSAEGKVLAPLSGRILKVNVTNGAVVMPGDSVAELAVDGYILRLKIPERVAHFIKQGDKLDVQLNDQSEKIAHGSIEKIYPEIDSGYVIADLAAEDIQHYFIDERVTVFVPTADRDAIIIPSKYLSINHGNTYAKLADDTMIMVQPGSRNGDMVEILAGLKENDMLVAQ